MEENKYNPENIRTLEDLREASDEGVIALMNTITRYGNQTKDFRELTGASFVYTTAQTELKRRGYSLEWTKTKEAEPIGRRVTTRHTGRPTEATEGAELIIDAPLEKDADTARISFTVRKEVADSMTKLQKSMQYKTAIPDHILEKFLDEIRKKKIMLVKATPDI